MRVNSFCPFCEKTTPSQVVEAVVAHTIKGVEVPVSVKFSQCDACGGQFNGPELDQDVAALALDAYRDKAGLLKPDQIRAFRAAFDLTQQELARILGWGTATLSRYENGAIQDEAHDRALRLIMRPGALLTELAERSGVLEPARREQVLDKLRHPSMRQAACLRYIREHAGFHPPGIMNGYRAFAPERFRAMALHFCREPGAPRTKLYGLLWYADFLAFRENTASISGARYVRRPHGPMPDGGDTLLAWLVDPEGALRHDEVSSDAFDREVLVASEVPDYGQFSNSELALLAQVAERFKDATAREVSDLSHNEPGHENTRDGEIISYAFAERMRLVIR